MSRWSTRCRRTSPWRSSGTATAGSRASRSGTPDGPLERKEESDQTGTTVTFYASPEIFETTTYSYEKLAARFREMAFLNKGLTISVTDERPDRQDLANPDDPTLREGGRSDTFCYADGLIDYVRYLTRARRRSTRR